MIKVAGKMHYLLKDAAQQRYFYGGNDPFGRSLGRIFLKGTVDQ